MHFRKIALAAALGAAVAAGPLAVAPASAQKVLKAVMHSDVKIIDPIWTTAYISRNVGYMIYDTLFALDAKNDVKPQMVDKVDISADKLTYTMTLRDGLLWHDGQPVTAEDCVVSLKRWSAKDSLGQKVFTGFVSEIAATDAKTIVIKLKEPTGLLLFALGKPSSNVPFMMPKRIAETDPGKQISEFIGSGPFVLKRDEWKPGDKIVFVKFDKYKPRAEPASAFAGGKVVNVDRVESNPRFVSISRPANAAIRVELKFDMEGRGGALCLHHAPLLDERLDNEGVTFLRENSCRKGLAVRLGDSQRFRGIGCKRLLRAAEQARLLREIRGM